MTGEGRERAMRDGGDSGVVMMAVVVEEGGGGQQRRRWTMIVAEDNGMQDRVGDYDGEGQERVAREGGDRRVAMMAPAAEDGGGGRRWRWWTRTARADDDSGGRQRQRMMTAREIKRRTTRGKEESGWQTTNIPSNDIALRWDVTSSWMHDGGDSDSMGRNLPGELKCLVMIIGDPRPGGWASFPMGGTGGRGGGRPVWLSADAMVMLIKRGLNVVDLRSK
jgi:hypothetical protein